MGKINWKDVQIFLFGFYSLGVILLFIFIILELGSINQRILMTILLIFGIGMLPLLNKKGSP